MTSTALSPEGRVKATRVLRPAMALKRVVGSVSEPTGVPLTAVMTAPGRMAESAWPKGPPGRTSPTLRPGPG